MINKIIHSCLQIWNFSSRVQLNTNSIQFIFFCSIPYSFTALTHEIANWTLEEKFVIKVHLCFIIHLLNKDKMADFVIQPRCKIPEKLSYSTNFNAWRGSIAQWSYGSTIIDCWPQKRLLMNVKPLNLLISAPAKIAKGLKKVCCVAVEL